MKKNSLANGWALLLVAALTIFTTFAAGTLTACSNGGTGDPANDPGTGSSEKPNTGKPEGLDSLDSITNPAVNPGSKLAGDLALAKALSPTSENLFPAVDSLWPADVLPSVDEEVEVLAKNTLRRDAAGNFYYSATPIKLAKVSLAAATRAATETDPVTAIAAAKITDSATLAVLNKLIYTATDPAASEPANVFPDELTLDANGQIAAIVYDANAPKAWYGLTQPDGTVDTPAWNDTIIDDSDGVLASVLSQSAGKVVLAGFNIYAGQGIYTAKPLELTEIKIIGNVASGSKLTLAAGVAIYGDVGATAKIEVKASSAVVGNVYVAGTGSIAIDDNQQLAVSGSVQGKVTVGATAGGLAAIDYSADVLAALGLTGANSGTDWNSPFAIPEGISGLKVGGWVVGPIKGLQFGRAQLFLPGGSTVSKLGIIIDSDWAIPEGRLYVNDYFQYEFRDGAGTNSFSQGAGGGGTLVINPTGIITLTDEGALNIGGALGLAGGEILTGRASQTKENVGIGLSHAKMSAGTTATKEGWVTLNGNTGIINLNAGAATLAGRP
jgi:hypothetical protein